MSDNGYIKRFMIPGLATVILDTTNSKHPALQIELAPEYQGDLRQLAMSDAPDRPYLQCDHATAVNNARLAAFMEVLHHWDYDADGKFDGDDVAQAIEKALWDSKEEPDIFKRPGGFIVRRLMRLMPPQPERHIVFGYGHLQKRFRWYDYVWAVPAIVAFGALVLLQVHYLPWTRYSVLTGGWDLVRWLGIPMWALGLAVGLLVGGMLRKRSKPNAGDSPYSMHTYGFFNRAAVVEEQAYREGAEHWNFRQRATSCLIFGVVHMGNLIYPLASILPIAIGGACLMAYYLRALRRTPFRRTAVLATSVKHRLYNRVALVGFVIWLLTSTGFNLYGVLAVVLGAAGLATVDYLLMRSAHKKIARLTRGQPVFEH